MRKVASVVAALLSIAPLARAQSVVVAPNTISGTLSFGNTNPDVVAIESSDSALIFVEVAAASTNPTGYQSSTSGPTTGSPTSVPYSLNAEGSGGVGQVDYQVNASIYYGKPDFSSFGNYFYPTRHTTLRPVDQQPQGAHLDFSEVMTVHRIRFGTDATCAVPVQVSSGYITLATPAIVDQMSFNATSEVHYLMPNDVTGPFVVPLHATLGNDTYSNTFTLSFQIDVSPAGDTIVDHCIPMPSQDGAGTGSLGTFATPVSLPGHTIGSMAYSGSHADGANGRNGFAYTSPISLINLLPGDWRVNLVRINADRPPTGLQLQVGTIGPLSITGGSISDGSMTFDGVPVLPYQFNPHVISGSIRLYDDYLHSHPGAFSTLATLDFSPNGSGHSWENLLNESGAIYLNGEGSSMQALLGWTGVFNPVTAEMSATYSMPVPVPYNRPMSLPGRPSLQLLFASAPNFYNTLSNGLGGATDPATFRLGHLAFGSTQPDEVLQPGVSSSADWALCFSDVTVQLSSTTAQFINPTIDVQTSQPHAGLDLNGQPLSYNANGSFTGMPFVGNGQSAAVRSAMRSSSGQVGLALAPGSWSLTPRATFVNSDGTTSNSNFTPIPLNIQSCGQRLVLVPGLNVSIDAPAACVPPTAGALTVPLTGSIHATNTNADRVWYTVNNGPEIDICNGNCGATYSVNASLAPGSNSITVKASSRFVDGTPQVSESIACGANGCGDTCTTNSCTDVVHAPEGRVMFEDLYPLNGDADYNDATVSYSYDFALVDGAVTSMRGTFNMLSLGANLDSSVYLHLPGVPRSNVADITTYLSDGTSARWVPYEGGTDTTVALFEGCSRGLFGYAAGYINTDPALATRQAKASMVVVNFITPMANFDTGAAPYDLFLVRCSDFSHQVHLPEFDGAQTGMNASLFGTGDDGSTPGRHFVNKAGLPFALHVPTAAPWAKERITIDEVYPQIVDFAVSGGARSMDWYTTPDLAKAFTHGANQSLPPAPLTVELAPDPNLCTPGG